MLAPCATAPVQRRRPTILPTMATVASLGVRRARPEDFGPLAAMLARAFYDDPVTAWFYPNAARGCATRGASSPSACASCAAGADVHQRRPVGRGAVGAAGPLAGGPAPALLLLPMLPVLLPRLARTARAVREIERRHPEAPHYYLSVIGTEPGRQGGGIGSALLAPMLDRCDETKRRPTSSLEGEQRLLLRPPRVCRDGAHRATRGAAALAHVEGSASRPTGRRGGC